MLRARSDEAKDVRRQALLSAALDEFFEKGFAATRMSDIAKRAKLSKGALYLYFDSKVALFEALIESLAMPNLQHMRQIMNGASSVEEALNGFQTFAPMLVRHTDLPRLLKVLVGDSHTFPDLVSRYRKDLIEQVLAMVTALLERAKSAGEIEVENPTLTARLVIAPLILSAVWQAVFNRRGEAEVDLETLFRIHGQLMLKALRPA
ncbi:MAG: TetR/AcrR family transcriptional regulator [Hyphomonas sp.]|uniref:TetR/AcrR family transcriptional regulator n=1 Tax=Hyphomonas sp. TaxID=87 RepID=UPI0035297296